MFKTALCEIKCEKKALILGGVISTALSTLIWVLFSGCECVWYYYLIPPAVPPRIVVLIGNAVWAFLYGATVAHLFYSCSVPITARRKALTDLAIATPLLYLWYPLMFAGAKPVLAIVCLIGCGVFTVFAVIALRFRDVITVVVSALSVVRLLFYVGCAVSFTVLNYMLY